MHTHTHKHKHFSSPISVQIERTIEALHLRYFVSETKINMHKHFYTFHKKSRSVASYAIGEGGGYVSYNDSCACACHQPQSSVPAPRRNRSIKTFHFLNKLQFRGCVVVTIALKAVIFIHSCRPTTTLRYCSWAFTTTVRKILAQMMLLCLRDEPSSVNQPAPARARSCLFLCLHMYNHSITA